MRIYSLCLIFGGNETGTLRFFLSISVFTCTTYVFKTSRLASLHVTHFSEMKPEIMCQQQQTKSPTLLLLIYLYGDAAPQLLCFLLIKEERSERLNLLGFSEWRHGTELAVVGCEVGGVWGAGCVCVCVIKSPSSDWRHHFVRSHLTCSPLACIYDCMHGHAHTVCIQ